MPTLVSTCSISILFTVVTFTLTLSHRRLSPLARRAALGSVSLTIFGKRSRPRLGYYLLISVLHMAPSDTD